MRSLFRRFFTLSVVAWSPSFRRGSPASKSRCRESDTRTVARVFQTLLLDIGKKDRSRRTAARIPSNLYITRTMEMHARCFLNKFDEGVELRITYITWASHRAYSFARSCAVQRIQNRVCISPSFPDERSFDLDGCYIS
jgi:hypothetical protein